VIINAPLIVAGVSSALVEFKLGKLTRKKFIFQIVLWLVILIGLATVKPIYSFLFSNGLTQTEPLSLFDVVQLTGIIFVLFMANRSRIKLEAMERRVQDLHQELSIRLSSDERKLR